MKEIIDIPDHIYEMVTNTGTFGCYRFDTRKAIKNGTPIPDDASNGDVIKAMFPDSWQKVYDICAIAWWNAPYQKGGTNRKNCEYRHENGNCLKVGGFCMSVDDEHCVKEVRNDKRRKV